MNIVLIGFRGTGKTTICKLLASRLNKKFISVEDELIKKTKLNSVKLAEKYDSRKLYEIESEVIEKISDFDECIVDTGYGIVMRNENIINLKRNSLIILLTADIKTITSRIRVKNRHDYINKIKPLLQEYEYRYRNAADYVIDVSRLSPEEICDLITHYVQTEIQ